MTRPHRARLVLSPLWLLVALTTLLGLGTSSTAAASGPETRVRALDHVAVEAVAAHDGNGPASVRCLRPAQPDFVSGSCVATNAAGLSDDVVRLADSHLTGSGETVLGHYADDYIGLAQSRGASYFDIGDAYNGLTPAQQWAANQRVLDAAIANGDRITLATSRLNIRPGSSLAREIAYLTGPAGKYQWLDDLTLVPAG